MPSYTGKARIHFYQVAAMETQLEWAATTGSMRDRNWDEAKCMRLARAYTAYPWTDFNARRMLEWVRNWINAEELK